MALIGAILVEIKIIEILCGRSLREGDRYVLNHGISTCRIKESKVIFFNTLIYTNYLII